MSDHMANKGCNKDRNDMHRKDRIMTEKLYDKDAYQKSFEAMVLSCKVQNGISDEKASSKPEEEMKESICYEVSLDKTLFFPEEGGQTPDRGILGGVKVLDVQLKEGVIVHTLEQPLKEGSVVAGEIDWDHRFSNMQQHSGEHIFSGLVYKHYGYANVGFHLSDQIVTMDFDGPLTMDQAAELEREVNKVIVANAEIKSYYPTKEDLAQMEYRSKKEIDGEIRIVEIEGYDLCACCAPHVARTGEIGGFKIQTLQNYKGGVRISFLCGFRALEEARKKAQILSELSSILTTSQEQLAENVQKLKIKNQELQIQLNQAKQALVELKLEQIPKDQSDVLLFEENLEPAVMRNVINRLMKEHPGICGIFVVDNNLGKDNSLAPEYKFILGSKSVDCRQIANLLREKLGARGGGSATMIQGSLQAEKEIIWDIITNS